MLTLTSPAVLSARGKWFFLGRMNNAAAFFSSLLSWPTDGRPKRRPRISEWTRWHEHIDHSTFEVRGKSSLRLRSQRREKAKKRGPGETRPVPPAPYLNCSSVHEVQPGSAAPS